MRHRNRSKNHRLTSERAVAGTRAAATWLFVLPFFTAGVAKDAAKIQTAGLALLALAWVTALRQHPSKADVHRIGLTTAALILLPFAYMTFQSWPLSTGAAHSYDLHAAIFSTTYITVAVFAVLFYESKLFERILWIAASAALWISIVACITSRLTHDLLLVSFSHDVIRLRGTLSEPSAWAPVIPLVVLLAIRRRSWLNLALALVGAVLADSPICFIVLATAIPVYYLLTGGRALRRQLLVASAPIIALAVFFIQTASPSQYLQGSNSLEKAAGRLLSGIRNIETGGKLGHNTRYEDTLAVIQQLRLNGWLVAGVGPGAESTYFPAKYPGISGNHMPTAFWVSILFDFGIIGVAILGVLMLLGLWRMRDRPDLAAIYVPFFLASLINSAEGSFEYSFIVLGIMLSGFGWSRRSIARSDDHQATRLLRRRPGPARSQREPDECQRKGRHIAKQADERHRIKGVSLQSHYSKYRHHATDSLGEAHRTRTAMRPKQIVSHRRKGCESCPGE
jgi:hypothetical protein